MAVVVLGNRLESAEVHPELRGRMDEGVRVFRATGAEHMILTGGQANPDVPVTEAEAMRDYAVRNGVESSAIHLETEAMDTIQNGIFSRRVLDGLSDVYTVYVVSSCYHMRRSKFIFEQCLGAGYEVDASNCYEADKLPSELYEDERMGEIKASFAPISPGDVDAIEKRYKMFIADEKL